MSSMYEKIAYSCSERAGVTPGNLVAVSKIERRKRVLLQEGFGGEHARGLVKGVNYKLRITASKLLSKAQIEVTEDPKTDRECLEKGLKARQRVVGRRVDKE